MKFGVVTFPGSNCDDDMVYVLSEVLGQKTVRLWHKDTDTQGVDCIVLPGGFSYGDYLRSGAIARFSPIMNEVVRHAERGGYLLGICNGFQILCESGLIKGALLHNESQKFICKNVFLKPATNQTALTRSLENRAYKVPIAHGEGRFFAHEDELKKIQDEDRILFHYVDENSNITAEANPNGSVLNIAGICNEKRNVFGMMPHPERAADKELSNTDGAFVLKSLLESI